MSTKRDPQGVIAALRRERLRRSEPQRALLARADKILKRGRADFKRDEQYAVLLDLRRLVATLRTTVLRGAPQEEP